MSTKGFDLDDPKLPKGIAKAALTSGGFPYAEELDRKAYEEDLERLQVQLVRLQSYLLATGDRVVIVFEGRDAAGKGGTIRRYMENLNPRNTINVALPKPNDRERGQWYFQRYVDHLPAAGETVLFDRSWYNRSGVERVMGFCTEQQAETFLAEAPRFEAILVEDGIHFFKFFLTIGREMQLKRFHDRRHSPLKQWKLSPIDIRALDLWDEYTEARDRTLKASDKDHARWTVIRANDKRRARLEVIRTVLSAINYEGRDDEAVGIVDPSIALSVAKFFDEEESEPGSARGKSA